MDIDLTSLLVFRHVARSGSFTEAGKYWKISQPSVSLMVSKLESSVGLILLERSISGNRLTLAGSHFLHSVNEVCDAYLTFLDGMRTLMRRTDREVLVGIDRSWFGTLLHEAVEQRTESNGTITKLYDLSETWWEDLEASKCDVVAAGRFLRNGLTPGIQEAVIRRERGITVAWNQDFYPIRPEIFNFPEILTTTVLIPDSSVVTGFAAFVTQWCEYAYGIQPANVVNFTSEVEAAAAAAAGLGLFIGPGDALPRLGSSGECLTRVKTFELLLPEAFTFGVYCRSDEDSKDVLGVAASVARLGCKLFQS